VHIIFFFFFWKWVQIEAYVNEMSLSFFMWGMQEYLMAGADFIETNTFNGTPISQSDYDTQHLVRNGQMKKLIY